MNIKIKYLLPIIPLFFSITCNLPNDSVPLKFTYSVNSILYTGNSPIKVYFNRVADIDSLDYYNSAPLDAIVTINGVRLNIVSGGYHRIAYYEISNLNFIKAANTYCLRIIYKDISIDGRTTLPGDFIIDNYPKESNYYYGYDPPQIKVTWTKSENASGYLFQAVHHKVSVSISNDIYDSPYPGTVQATNDTSCYVKMNPDMSYCVVKVFAYDENCRNYYIDKSFSSGLNNAYGVFGSMVMDSVKLIINKQ